MAKIEISLDDQIRRRVNELERYVKSIWGDDPLLNELAADLEMMVESEESWHEQMQGEAAANYFHESYFARTLSCINDIEEWGGEYAELSQQKLLSAYARTACNLIAFGLKSEREDGCTEGEFQKDRYARISLTLYSGMEAICAARSAVSNDSLRANGSRGGQIAAAHWEVVTAEALRLADLNAPVGGWKSAEAAAAAIKDQVSTYARLKGRDFSGEPQRTISKWLRTAGIKRSKCTD